MHINKFNFNNLQFNNLKSIGTSKNYKDLEQKPETIALVKKIFLDMVTNKDPLYKSQFNWFQKLVLYIPRLFFYLSFNSALLAVQKKIDQVAQGHFESTENNQSLIDLLKNWKGLNASVGETLEQVATRVEKTVSDFKTLQSDLSALMKDIKTFTENTSKTDTEKQISFQNKAQSISEKCKTLNESLNPPKLTLLDLFKSDSPISISDKQKSLLKYKEKFESIKEKNTTLVEAAYQLTSKINEIEKSLDTTSTTLNDFGFSDIAKVITEGKEVVLLNIKKLGIEKGSEFLQALQEVQKIIREIELKSKESTEIDVTISQKKMDFNNSLPNEEIIKHLDKTIKNCIESEKLKLEDAEKNKNANIFGKFTGLVKSKIGKKTENTEKIEFEKIVKLYNLSITWDDKYSGSQNFESLKNLLEQTLTTDHIAEIQNKKDSITKEIEEIKNKLAMAVKKLEMISKIDETINDTDIKVINEDPLLLEDVITDENTDSIHLPEWHRLDYFTESLTKLTLNLVDSADITNDKGLSKFVYKIFLLLTILFHKNEHIKKIIPHFFKLLKPSDENGVQSWLETLNKIESPSKIDDDSLKFIEYINDTIANQNINPTQLVTDLSKLPDLTFNFQVANLRKLDSYPNIDDFFFSKRESIDDNKKLEVKNLISDILGIPGDQCDQLSLDLQLLIVDILRGVNTIIKKITSLSENSIQTLFDKIIEKMENYNTALGWNWANINLIKQASYPIMPWIIQKVLPVITTEDFIKSKLGKKDENQESIYFEIRDSIIGKIFKSHEIIKHAQTLAIPYLLLTGSIKNYRNEQSENYTKELNKQSNLFLPKIFEVIVNVSKEILKDEDYLSFFNSFGNTEDSL
jgi:hypothetical protein